LLWTEFYETTNIINVYHIQTFNDAINYEAIELKDEHVNRQLKYEVEQKIVASITQAKPYYCAVEHY